MKIMKPAVRVFILRKYIKVKATSFKFKTKLYFTVHARLKNCNEMKHTHRKY